MSLGFGHDEEEKSYKQMCDDLERDEQKNTPGGEGVQTYEQLFVQEEDDVEWSVANGM